MSIQALGSLNGCLSAELIIDNHADSFQDIVNSLKSVVGIASRDADGNLHFQLVNRDHWESPFLLYNAPSRVTLPLVVFGVFDETSVDAPPQPVG